jgi:hypothetical protein
MLFRFFMLIFFFFLSNISVSQQLLAQKRQKTVKVENRSELAGELLGFAIKTVFDYSLKEEECLQYQTDIRKIMHNFSEAEDMEHQEEKIKLYRDIQKNISDVFLSTCAQDNQEIKTNLEVVFSYMYFELDERKNSYKHALQVFKEPFNKITKNAKIKASDLLCKLSQINQNQEDDWCLIRDAFLIIKDDYIESLKTCALGNETSNQEACAEVAKHISALSIDFKPTSDLLSGGKVISKTEDAKTALEIALQLFTEDCSFNALTKNPKIFSQCYWKAITFEALDREKEASTHYFDLCSSVENNKKKNYSSDSYDAKSCQKANSSQFIQYFTPDQIFKINEIGCVLINSSSICTEVLKTRNIYNDVQKYKSIVNNIARKCLNQEKEVCTVIEQFNSNKMVISLTEISVSEKNANQKSWDSFNGYPDLKISMYLDGIFILETELSDVIQSDLSVKSFAFETKNKKSYLYIKVEDVDITSDELIFETTIEIEKDSRYFNISKELLKSLKFNVISK